MARVRALASISALLLLAGCISPPRLPDLPDVTPPQAELDIEVTAARVQRGTCMGDMQAFDLECHVLQVQVALPPDPPRQSLPTQVMLASSWVAEPDGGRGWADPDAGFLEAGQSANITVTFERPEGSPVLTTLRYTGLRARGEAPIPAYAPGATDGDLVRLEVLAARIEPGRCFSEAFTDSECHRLTVRVDNTNHNRSVALGELSWKAADQGGGTYGHMEVQQSGPSSVAARGTATVTVSFDLSPGAPRLATVILDDSRVSIRVSAPVGPY